MHVHNVSKVIHVQVDAITQAITLFQTGIQTPGAYTGPCYFRLVYNKAFSCSTHRPIRVLMHALRCKQCLPEHPVDKREAAHSSPRFQVQSNTAESLCEGCHAGCVQGLALVQQHLLGN